MKILLDISSHGFGHIAQTAPIANALNKPELQWTVRSRAPCRILKERLAFPFEWIDEASDIGIRMKNAIEVDVEATECAYAAFHRDWEVRVEKEAEWIASFDLVLSNVSYLPLKAAHLAGIPSAAFCSLNWADLYRHYCGEGGIHAQILDAYKSAAFLKIEPSMPMGDLGHAERIGPIAAAGRCRKEEISRLLGLRPGVRLGLVSMGGMPFSIPFEKWPDCRNMHWLVPADAGRPGMTAFGKLSMPFPDLVASSDVMITKPGYGSFSEAAASNVPVLYLSRPEWPEEPYLIGWLKEAGRCLELDRKSLLAGDLDEAIESLLSMPEKPVPEMTGIAEAALRLGSFFT